VSTTSVLGNSVPAAAGRQRGRALFIFAGRKGCGGGHYTEHFSDNNWQVNGSLIVRFVLRIRRGRENTGNGRAVAC